MAYIDKTVLFAKSTLQKQIAANGKQFLFLRVPSNEFGEPNLNERPQEVCTIDAIYHDSFNSFGGYSSQVLVDAARVAKMLQPMLLCLKDDCETLCVGDFTVLNDEKYKIIAIKDINNLGFGCEISLEAYHG